MTSRKYKVVITNDDGIESPGLAAAVQAVEPFAEVLIVAPATQQTAMGRAQVGKAASVLQKRVLTIGDRQFEGFACEAAPARVLGHALNIFSDFRPDLVISGINYGENLGANITSSGTVGAAMEGAYRGIPAIAASLETPIHSHFTYTEQNWESSIQILRRLAYTSLSESFPADVDILKVDVPSTATPDSPWRITRLSKTLYYRSTLDNPSLTSPLGEAVTSKGADEQEPEDTDVYALAVDRVVSVTPISLDLTAKSAFSRSGAWGACFKQS